MPNEKAIAYLESKLPSIKNDSYTLSVVAYALRLANSKKAEQALQLLEHLAKTAGM